ncbi:MAG: AAA family ATPase [Myxococcales bacterium]|nr:MAG: AAA family ATPase [Myxococcales bacterium]
MNNIKIVLLLLSLANFSFSLNHNLIIEESYFSKRKAHLLLKLEKILHPILHGHGEPPKKGLLQKTYETSTKVWEDLKEFNLSAAYKTASKDNSFWQMAKTLAGGTVNYFAGERAEKVLFHGGFYDSPEAEMNEERFGSESINLLSSLEEELEQRFERWKPQTECPDGLKKCKKIGLNSKNILKGLYAFLENIENYERKHGADFFSKDEINRIFNFLDLVVVRLSEINIIGSIGNQEKNIVTDDSILQPYVRVINLLAAIPTKTHDVEKSLQENSDKILELMEFLPEKQKLSLLDYIRKLSYNAHNKTFAHSSGGCSSHLLFSGPTGTGKTFVGKKLPELLGFKPICMSLEELQRGQDNFSTEILDLVDGEDLSGLEKKILQLDARCMQAVCHLNQIVFIDELDEDRNYQISDLKEQFDQFKKLNFPSLGLQVPGFLNCIFTTNNQKLLRDPALISRFTEIEFPPMNFHRKLDILSKHIYKKYDSEQFSELRKNFSKKELDKHLEKFIKFDERINIRILIENVDDILFLLDVKRRVELGDENILLGLQARESFDDFLRRKFGKLDLGDLDYSSSSDEEEQSESECDEEEIQDLILENKDGCLRPLYKPRDLACHLL